MAHDTVEIYVPDLLEDDAVEWLQAVFGEVEEREEALVKTYVTTFEGDPVPVQIAEKVENGPYTSLWFNAPNLPWDNAPECARAAYEGLQTEVLCFLNDPEQPWTMLRVADGGEEFVDKREVRL